MFAEIILQPVDWAPSRLDPGPIELPNGKRRWRRNQVACDACHARRVRCDMVYSSPCSRCKHKNVECAITRERRKRGRRGRAERANAKRIHETLVHDTPTTQEEARQNETCSDDESLPASSPIDTTVTDPATRPNTPATDNIEIGDNSDSEKTGTCSNTSSSQILEELGMGLTEDCLPTAHLFQGFLDLSAENDISLPPLPDIYAADDITLHAASDLPSESSIPSPQIVDHLLSPNDKPKPVCDDSIYAAELETADFLLVDLLETATYGANMSMSCFLATRIETEPFYGELYCSV